jgi:undecaprenyl-diphosphatase
MSSSRKAAAAALFAVFGWLAVVVASGSLLPFDLPVRGAAHGAATPTITMAMRGFTALGSGPSLVALGAVVVVWLLRAGRRRSAKQFVWITLGGNLLSEIAKLVFARPRPAPFFGFELPGGYSFPSGHSFMAVCFFGALAGLVAPHCASRAARTAIWAAVGALALLIGFSRIYLGVHYPSDVLGGFCLASSWVLVFARPVGK